MGVRVLQFPPIAKHLGVQMFGSLVHFQVGVRVNGRNQLESAREPGADSRPETLMNIGDSAGRTWFQTCWNSGWLRIVGKHLENVWKTNDLTFQSGCGRIA